MEDNRIVDLYFERSEQAITETELKYGRYCHKIAYNVLYSNPDAEECVNDTYMKAWSTIPPTRPSRLSAFLGKITRNIAINRYLHDRAEKRSAPVELALDELSEVIADGMTGEAQITDGISLRDALNDFLAASADKPRKMFVKRYWYMLSVRDIAEEMGFSESYVKVTLYRMRQRLKERLEKEGIEI